MEAIGCEIGNGDGKTIVMSVATICGTSASDQKGHLLKNRGSVMRCVSPAAKLWQNMQENEKAPMAPKLVFG